MLSFWTLPSNQLQLSEMNLLMSTRFFVFKYNKYHVLKTEHFIAKITDWWYGRTKGEVSSVNENDSWNVIQLHQVVYFLLTFIIHILCIVSCINCGLSAVLLEFEDDDDDDVTLFQLLQKCG